MKYLLLFLIIPLEIGCTSRIEEVKKVYASRDKIVELFTRKSLFRDSPHQITLFTYKEELKNTYVFTKNMHEYKLSATHILFYPDTILMQKGEHVENRMLNELLLQRLTNMTNFLDSLSLRSISSDFRENGITLKLYMKKGQVLIFVSDISTVKNREWINYIESMKKLDSHWYYLNSEQ